MTDSSESLPHIFLKPGQDQRLNRGHPWGYSNEIRMDAAAKAFPPGTFVCLNRFDGKPIGVGSFNPHALIAFRLFGTDPNLRPDHAFFVARFHRALTLRHRLYTEPYYRLVHAEADGLPGLIADRFGDVLVIQINTAGMDALTPALLAAVEEVLSPVAVVLRNDTAMRQVEGLEQAVGVAVGQIATPVEVREGGVTFLADVLAGQKTGWFFDQRDNRAAVAAVCSGARLLDVFCHSGGFAIAAAVAGARGCLGVDSSESALALAKLSAEHNRVDHCCEFRRGDAFDVLNELNGKSEQFDVVVCDPPAFVKSRKDLASGLRGYRKLARLAASAVTPGGMLFIASCSHNVEPGAFATEVVRGIGAAGRTGRIIREGHASADHPQHLHLPESAYLKALLIQLD